MRLWESDETESVACRDCWLQLGQRGSANHNWKGGRTKHHAGYIMVRVPGHPRAKTGNGDYVFEHILVMEGLLGRHLHLEESVHHLNGVRNDNRPSNLELWIKPQPSGIHVEDAFRWAYEIVARYEALEQHPQQRFPL